MNKIIPKLINIIMCTIIMFLVHHLGSEYKKNDIFQLHNIVPVNFCILDIPLELSGSGNGYIIKLKYIKEGELKNVCFNGYNLEVKKTKIGEHILTQYFYLPPKYIYKGRNSLKIEFRQKPTELEFWLRDYVFALNKNIYFVTNDSVIVSREYKSLSVSITLGFFLFFILEILHYIWVNYLNITEKKIIYFELLYFLPIFIVLGILLILPYFNIYGESLRILVTPGYLGILILLIIIFIELLIGLLFFCKYRVIILSSKSKVTLTQENKILILFSSAIILYSLLSPIWIDPDGIYNLASAIKGANNPLSIYNEWRFGPFYYGWGPFYSWILLLVHPVFKFLGFTSQSIWYGTAFNHFTYYLFKWLTKIPFVLGGGILIYKMYGLAAVCLWLFNPIIIWFIILAGLNDIYPAFFLIMAIYFLRNNKLLAFIISIAFGLLSKQTVSLIIPVLIITLFLKSPKFFLKYIVLLFVLVFIISLPYKLYSGGYDYLMSDNFWARWSTHLGMCFTSHGGYYYLNIILYSFVLMFMIFKKIELNFINFSLFSMLFFLIYIFNYGIGYERWVVTALPLIITTTIFLSHSMKNKFVYIPFWIFSFLPPLIQFGWRDKQFKMPHEIYTLFENTSIPFRLLNIFKRQELSPDNLANYLLSIQAGIILFFLFFVLFYYDKLLNIEEKQIYNYCLQARYKKRLIFITVLIFLIGLVLYFCKSKINK